MRTSLISIAIMLAASACTPVENAAIAHLGTSPVLDGGSYSTGGGITVAAELRDLRGQIGLCGVWAESKHQSILSKGAALRVMHTGAAYMGDTVIHRDLAFMAKVAPSDSYAGQQANCVQTAQPWVPGTSAQAVQLRLPRQEVNRDASENEGANVRVLFSQTGPGAMNPSLKSLILGE